MNAEQREELKRLADEYAKECVRVERGWQADTKHKAALHAAIDAALPGAQCSACGNPLPAGGCDPSKSRCAAHTAEPPIPVCPDCGDPFGRYHTHMHRFNAAAQEVPTTRGPNEAVAQSGTQTRAAPAPGGTVTSPPVAAAPNEPVAPPLSADLDLLKSFVLQATQASECEDEPTFFPCEIEEAFTAIARLERAERASPQAVPADWSPESHLGALQDQIHDYGPIRAAKATRLAVGAPVALRDALAELDAGYVIPPASRIHKALRAALSQERPNEGGTDV
jgi:hypothetical protein